jgi:hypothetical protein
MSSGFVPLQRVLRRFVLRLVLLLDAFLGRREARAAGAVGAACRRGIGIGGRWSGSWRGWSGCGRCWPIRSSLMMRG